MTLKLVVNSATILEFKTKNSRETIAILEHLLAGAKTGEIAGIAGVFTTAQDDLGTFYAGECCKNPSQTISDLNVLHSEIMDGC